MQLGFFSYVVAGFVLSAIVTQFLTQEDPDLLRPILIPSRDTIDHYLLPYKATIGDEYEGYRGHCHRVLAYALHYLDSVDSAVIISKALVYHDIGLWTNHTLSYLEPSSELMRLDMEATSSPEEVSLMHDIIDNHHKITTYSTTKGNAQNDRIVEAVRKADLIDFSGGLISNGMPRMHISKVMSEVPNSGFQLGLATVAFRLHGANLFTAIRDISAIFKF